MKATPKQQQMYDALMLQARSTLFNDHSFQSVVKQIREDPDGPVEAIGEVAANIMRSMIGGIAQGGKKVPPEVTILTLASIVGDLTAIAASAAVVKDNETSGVAKKALAYAAKELKTAAKGGPGLVEQPMGA